MALVRTCTQAAQVHLLIELGIELHGWLVSGKFVHACKTGNCRHIKAVLQQDLGWTFGCYTMSTTIPAFRR